MLEDMGDKKGVQYTLLSLKKLTFEVQAVHTNLYAYYFETIYQRYVKDTRIQRTGEPSG